MNKKNTPKTMRRWSLVRTTTGKAIRSFTSRDEARMYKRQNTFRNVTIWDNVNQVAVR